LALTVMALAAWLLHGFVEAALAAAITAVASWPAYTAFRARLPRALAPGVAAVMFTAAVTAFLLGPLVFAGWALGAEAHALLQGQPLPAALPAPLQLLRQHADPGALLGWAQSLGQFTFRQLLIVGFTVLLLAWLYDEGDALDAELRNSLRSAIGDRADHYLAVATAALRASVASMLVVSLFDGVAAAVAFAAAGAPRPLLWGAITGALAGVPFLGYAAVGALVLQMAWQGPAAAALLAGAGGCVVLLTGDKAVRPLVARDGMHLHFVFVLMGCIGGFEVLGLAGLVLGPVVLALARELWAERRSAQGAGADNG
jgi:predicted PurR-regulated permease PerM